jgi:hypothetical protein
LVGRAEEDNVKELAEQLEQIPVDDSKVESNLRLRMKMKKKIMRAGFQKPQETKTNSLLL